MKYLLLLVVVCTVVLSSISAADTSQIQPTIEALKSKISELQNQEHSLASEITKLDLTIAETTHNVATIQSNIEILSREIDELATEITRLEEQLTKRSELVLHRIPETYKRMTTPSFGVLLFSQNVSDFITRFKYVRQVQGEDAQLLVQLKATQNNFSERKDLREKKKATQEQLKKQLEEENRKLAIKKRERQSFLEQTKNSESVYQSLLAQAIAEQRAIEQAILNSVKVGPINQGDPIALVGNTGYPGCSTGAHLHFEIRKNNAWVNAEDYLSPRNVVDQQNGGNSRIGNGNWDWPLEGSIIVTQRFGKTPYSWRYTYSNGIHTGVDMVSSTSEIIRAPRSGILYTSSEQCGAGSIIKIKYIDHSDGLVSFYLHVQ